MQSLGQLQERLSAAFGGPVAKPPEERMGQPSPRPRTAAPAETDERQGAAPTRRLLFYWLGGAGLLAATILMLLAHAGDPLLLSGGLVVLGLAVIASYAVLMVRRRRSIRSGRQTRPEWNDGAKLFADVHDVLGDITVSRSMDRRIISANDTFRRLTGRLRPEGRTCEEIGLAFRPGPVPHCYDVEISTPEGQRIFLWRDVVTRDPANGRLLLQSVARDVTEERLIAQSREEARQKAEYNSAAKSRLLATVSHEVRTPLSGILGMTHLIAETRLTQEQQNYLASIRQSGHALTQLVEDLLDFSTIEVGRFELHPRSESLRKLLESVVEMLAHRAHEKGIEIGATVSSDVPENMSFDAARLRQVLFNVIGNAVKFTQAGGVFIRVLLDAGDLLITVADSGPGMTAEEQARVFGEFEQGGTIADKSSGTGLGLAISARIMREFGGALTVASEKGLGSTFSIRFPVDIGSERPDRRNTLLAGNSVVLLAPAGAARTAIAETITALGGICQLVADGETARARLLGMATGGRRPTDIIVDHRMSAEFSAHLADRAEIAALGLRKVLLVNPEERSAHPLDLFDAWLIRPLREQSLIDVLRGRMRGMEKRDALNDNQPGLGPPMAETLVAAHGLRILLGEDDPINAMLVRVMLEKGGHKVHHVEDFETLLDCALGEVNERPDIIISDLSMPGGNGIDMLGRLRGHERRLDLDPVPVIVLTADKSDESRRQVLLNGANRVMVKPVDPVRLLTEVQAVAALSARRAEAR
ncbi:PAS domain-containing hybrid sensor histidine kinase/response regulator [Rhizobium bangladeshense]|uniref:PAS domain-containing hybrid sensor histidine kinase/response regulator n=1 Tax=Rhizobium bangladeshense TaxID=1138189 RepID=UPI001C833FEB|nr:ATP-binding protein [Rhizobium bangladeshense]MBX4889183.1 response regulator [Rhizobium bangladeshense]MBX4896090.1 response regulator [Rhizobium bangladeshense]MBX4903083.1 response regulator [Rhizobium bangladeshense]MBX4914460.1 response regulator [Rhizobium bangladeshense]MBX4918496.1 response regulator [Rhizobium bangladeshense]